MKEEENLSHAGVTTFAPDLRDRLVAFIESMGMTHAEFCNSIHVRPNYISSIRSGIRQDKLRCISRTYPQLNVGWLVTGEGQMLNPGYEMPNESAPLRSLNAKIRKEQTAALPNAMQEKMEALTERVAELRAERDRLLSMLEAKDRQLDALLQRLLQ